VKYIQTQGKFFDERLAKKRSRADYVGYNKSLFKNKEVKATTIPLTHSLYGLVAIMCINIDSTQLQELDCEKLSLFRDKLIKIYKGPPPLEE
jgi:predicted transcriptional regulator YheO